MTDVLMYAELRGNNQGEISFFSFLLDNDRHHTILTRHPYRRPNQAGGGNSGA